MIKMCWQCSESSTTLTGWWFGTFFFTFPYLGNFIIPIDFHMFQWFSEWWLNHQPVEIARGTHIPYVFRIKWGAGHGATNRVSQASNRKSLNHVELLSWAGGVADWWLPRCGCHEPALSGSSKRGQDGRVSKWSYAGILGVWKSYIKPCKICKRWNYSVVIQQFSMENHHLKLVRVNHLYIGSGFYSYVRSSKGKLKEMIFPIVSAYFLSYPRR